MIQLISSKDHSKGRVSARDSELLGDKLGKGMNVKIETSRCINFFGVSWNRISLLNSLQMLDIGRNSIKWKIMYTLIKSHMGSDLDSLSINIIPNNAPSGVRNKAKENSLLGISDELSTALGRRSDPDTTSKSTEAREVISLRGS